MSASCTPGKLLSSCLLNVSPQSGRSFAVLFNLCPVLVCSWSSNCCPVTFAEVWLTTGLPCEAGCSPCESRRTLTTPLAFHCAASAVAVLPSLSLMSMFPPTSCDRRVALIGTPPRFWNPCSRSVEAAIVMTCQPRQQSRRVCRAGGYWQAARQFFETLRSEIGPPVSKPHGDPKSSSCPHAKGSSTEVDIPWPILLCAFRAFPTQRRTRP